MKQNRRKLMSVDFMASIGSPNENAPIDRTDDADAVLAKIDWPRLRLEA